MSSRGIRRLLVTGLGTGLLPVAPGTWGSLAATGVFLIAVFASGGSWIAVLVCMGAVAVASSVACVALGPFAEAEFGKKDPGQCTIDEWAGQAVALLALPLGPAVGDWLVAGAVAFVAFRAFDILKPPPAYQLQKLPAGWGILIDDLIAGVYANIVAQLFLRYVYVIYLR